MPYKNLDELPDNVKDMPKGAQEIFRSAFNSAWDTYADSEDRESKSFAIAFSAVKRKYHKIGDEWVEKGLIDTITAAVKSAFGIDDMEKGGTGSGNFGHAGRPGEIGGSVGGVGLGSGGDKWEIGRDKEYDPSVFGKPVKARRSSAAGGVYVGSGGKGQMEALNDAGYETARDGKTRILQPSAYGYIEVGEPHAHMGYLQVKRVPSGNIRITEYLLKMDDADVFKSARELSALYAVTPKKLKGLTDVHLQMVHDRVVVLKGSPTVNDVHIETYGEFDDEALERAYKAVLAELKRRGFDVGDVEKGREAYHAWASLWEQRDAVEKGGTGSGNFGHGGRPGEVGGSTPGGGGAIGGWTRDTALSAKRLKESGGGRIGQLDWSVANDGKTIYAEHYVSGSAAGTIDMETGELSPSTPKWEARLAEVRNHIIEAGARFADESELANLMDYPGKNARAIQSILDRRPELAGKFGRFSKSNSMSREAAFIQKDAKRQIVYGVVYEPNIVDIQKDWASAEEIEQACHKFMKAYRKMGIRHDGAVRDTIAPVESYIAPCDFQLGEQPVKKGSWVLAAHVESADTWKDVEDGRLTGFSLFGKAKRKRGSLPFEPEVAKGGPGSGNFGHGGRPGEVGGSMPGGGISIGNLGGAIARSGPGGKIIIDKEKYAALSPESRRSVIAHEIVHDRIEQYISDNNDEWNNAERALLIQEGRGGKKLFVGGVTRLNESYADIVSARVTMNQRPDYIPQKAWDWASGIISRAAQSESRLRAQIDSAYRQAEILASGEAGR